jgi:phage tail-like protein
MPEEPEAYPICRFYLICDKTAQGVFTEISGLQMEVDVMDYQEGGRNDFVHRLPGFTKVSNLTLKRGMTSSNEFYWWCEEVARGKFTRHNVSVVMCDAGGNKLMQWDFRNAYPVKWIGPQFGAADAAAAIETVELAHEGMSLVWPEER